MAKIGYVRVSTKEQNTVRQEVLMEQLGVEKMFVDKLSGKNTNRPDLQRMMDYVREGDVVIVESISRFARSTKDLLELVEQLAAKGVAFVSQKENIDTNTPQGEFMLTVFAAMAQLERKQIKERQAEGIAIAKENGKYQGRKAIPVGDAFFAITKLWVNGEITLKEAQSQLNMAPATFFRKCKQYGISKGGANGRV